MFWSTAAAESPINSLLEDENVSLECLLEQEDILHECKLGNEKLIEFLCKPQVLKQLVTFVTTEPPEDINEKLRYRYANMACEVLSCEKSQINESFASNPDLISILYDKLQSSEPLNPLMASFICKILFSLPQNSSNNIHLNREGFVTSLINHIGTSAVMDLLFKSLARQDTPDVSAIYMNFYHKQGLVDKLISLFKEDVDVSAQTNSAQLLCDIIRFSREQQTCNQEKAESNPLLSEIELTSTITQLLTNMFETRTESCLVNGIQVLQALLEYRRYRANLPPKHPPTDDVGSISGNAKVNEIGDIDDLEKVTYPLFSVTETALPDLMTPLDIERLTKSVRQVHAAIVPRLEDFHSLLINPPTKQPVRTTIGLIEKPFGATRVEVVHLIRALLSSNNPTINKKLTSLNTLPVLMDLFFAYPYNNFLHAQVEQSINCILDNAKSTSPITSPTGGLDDGDKDSDNDDNVVVVVEEEGEKVNDVKVEGLSEGEIEKIDGDNCVGGVSSNSTSTPNKSVGDLANDKRSKKYHKENGEEENVTSLVYQLLVEYNLIGKILEAYQQSIGKKSISKPSYLGHIIKIANHILSTKDIAVVKSCLDQLPTETKETWTKWVDETLNDINTKMQTPLVAEPSEGEPNYFSDDMAAPNTQLPIKIDINIQNMFSDFYSHYDTSDDSNLHDETIKSEEEELLS